MSTENNSLQFEEEDAKENEAIAILSSLGSASQSNTYSRVLPCFGHVLRTHSAQPASVVSSKQSECSHCHATQTPVWRIGHVLSNRSSEIRYSKSLADKISLDALQKNNMPLSIKKVLLCNSCGLDAHKKADKEEKRLFQLQQTKQSQDSNQKSSIAFIINRSSHSPLINFDAKSNDYGFSLQNNPL